MQRYTTKSIFVFMTLVAVAALTMSCSSTPKKELSQKERARLLLDVGNAALIEGDPTGALAALMQAEQADPDLAEIHQSMALAYFAKSNLPEALNQAQLAVKMSPDYPDANNTLGKILVDLGRFSEASAPLMKAAQNPLYREAYKSWTNLGILSYRKGDFAKASGYFEHAIDTSREEACIAYYYRGHLKLREGNFSEAVRDYQQATKRVCGGFADAHLAIGITYERTKQYDLARRTFLQVEQRFPNSKAADQAVEHMKALP